ncbi:LOW QUALITY PROTEIN: Hypothetical protein PHPALM_36873 [Phytophthora palmivora]|uniref:ZSWIM1/3 RNaseH-like domain-containing protein n=1 Tax=Phytophthora palmivora TaxID=4796 RepID=A0A2P4WYU5_9STRA|nr:LOW QUALITY PROTEIN: Hypothetical protein PHPALM_36873 [Phytophthora palmivora]
MDDEPGGGEDGDASDLTDITEPPKFHRTYYLRTKRVVTSWFYGFKSMFDAWEAFHEAFDDFQAETFQQFSKRTRTSRLCGCPLLENLLKKARNDVTLIPDEWETYSKTHGRPYDARGDGKRIHKNVRATNCMARVNLRVTASSTGKWYLRVNASGNHNHNLNKHIWSSYAENRTVKEPHLTKDAGANPQGILKYLRAKKNNLRDVHNMVQRHKSAEKAGLSDAQRDFAVLDEFCREHDGNSAQVLVDSITNSVRIAVFQTARMQRLFKAFPEDRYKLFRFVVHDVFGKGQYVQHAIVETEHMVNLRKVVEIFKENNPDWIKIRAAMTDKAVHEKGVLKEQWPEARQLLCQWYVITWLKKQTTRLAPAVKKEAKNLMRLLVYAKRKEEYEDGKKALLNLLGGDKAHELNWDANREEWVSYLRGNVPHLTNNTNNRIESKWGKIKDVIKDSLFIDQLLSALITLQEYGKEQYMVEYHRIGSLIDEDPELSLLGLQLSSFAFDLIEKQFGLATGAGADYNVDLAVPGTATLISRRTGESYQVNTRTCHVRQKNVQLHNCSASNEVSLQGGFPENNIDVGDISRGGLNQGASPPLSKKRTISSSTMYSDTKAIMEKIVDRMSLQSSPTFRVALAWRHDFYEALNSGNVVEFTQREQVTFPGFSQAASVGTQRKEVQARKNKEKALELAEKYRRGKIFKFATFSEVGTLLDGNYSLFDAKNMVDALPFPNVVVNEPVAKTSLAIDQDVPVIKAIPQLTKVQEAIEAIRKAGDIDLIAHWSDFGYATFDQLDTMARIIEARNRFALVMRTVKWTQEAEWNVCDVREPFGDTNSISKNEHSAYVETLNLATNKIPGELVAGYQLLDFRENLWLHTTSILVSMMVLRDEYPDVGVINPSFHGFASLEQKRRVTGGLGASNSQNKRVIGIFNISAHWVAFLVDKTKAVCSMFDPLQCDTNYAIFEKIGRRVIEDILQVKGILKYQKVDWCTQQDGRSCGVWCIAVLEMLLSDAQWDDCIYNLVPYLRMRFLHEAIAFVGKQTVVLC